MVAINCQHSHMVRELLGLGAAVNASSQVAGWGPVHLAARLGRVDLMKALLDQGGNASLALMGSSPLHVAARAGHTDLLRLLLLHGADVNAADHAGCSALHSGEISSPRNSCCRTEPSSTRRRQMAPLPCSWRRSSDTRRRWSCLWTMTPMSRCRTASDRRRSAWHGGPPTGTS